MNIFESRLSPPGPAVGGRREPQEAMQVAPGDPGTIRPAEQRIVALRVAPSGNAPLPRPAYA